MTTTVYLAGPIHGKTDAECMDWRAEARDRLERAGLAVLDPMVRDYRGREHEEGIEKVIVEGDKADIAHAQVFLAYVVEPSFGTAMELHYAWSIQRDTYAVVGRRRPSPWVRYHATPYPALDDALSAIIAKYGARPAATRRAMGHPAA